MKDASTLKYHADRADIVATELAATAESLLAGQFNFVALDGTRALAALADLEEKAAAAGMSRVAEHAKVDATLVQKAMDLAKESAERMGAERKACKPEDLEAFEDAMAFAVVAALSTPAASLVAMATAWRAWARAVDP